MTTTLPASSSSVSSFWHARRFRSDRARPLICLPTYAQDTLALPGHTRLGVHYASAESVVPDCERAEIQDIVPLQVLRGPPTPSTDDEEVASDSSSPEPPPASSRGSGKSSRTTAAAVDGVRRASRSTTPETASPDGVDDRPSPSCSPATRTTPWAARERAQFAGGRNRPAAHGAPMTARLAAEPTSVDLRPPGQQQKRPVRRRRRRRPSRL